MLPTPSPRDSLLLFLLLTLASVAGSLVITCLYTWALFGWPGEGYFSSYAIWRCALVGAVGVPAVMAPFAIWRVSLLVHDLGRAQETLAQLAATDALTGLLNRRGFAAQAESLLDTARARGQPVCALACDIDMFKSINDRFGHDGGDYVISRVGELLKERLRPAKALVCRHGGEEFVVLLPDVSVSHAMNWAERLRLACASEATSGGGLPAPITISVGVAEASASGASLADLLRCADIALYEAKRKGRNRVECFALPAPRIDAFA